VKKEVPIWRDEVMGSGINQGVLPFDHPVQQKAASIRGKIRGTGEKRTCGLNKRVLRKCAKQRYHRKP